MTLLVSTEQSLIVISLRLMSEESSIAMREPSILIRTSVSYRGS